MNVATIDALPASMRIRTILLITPLLVLFVLAQSLFWVPGYDQQAQGNPQRLFKFIDAGIGDARILNPILNADTVSSALTDRMFDGLLDLDEDLQLRGRLAERWEVHGEAYVLVPDGALFSDGRVADPAGLAAALASAVTTDDRLARVLGLREPPVVEPARIETLALVLEGERIEVRVRLPERLRIVTEDVVPGLQQHLWTLLADSASDPPDYRQWLVDADDAHHPGVMDAVAQRFPVVEHNPVIHFALRRDVRFHDGALFTARDVRFTWQAIMDPRNLSPRTADFEPIREIEILDDYTVRVIYARLFAPAINAWTIGILPEHLLNEEAMEREMDRRRLGSAARAAFGMRDSEFNRAPVGTGPFRFARWRSDEYIRLLRFEDYWAGAPEYHEFTYRVVPDSLTQELEFRAGALDSYQPQAHQVARLREQERTRVISSPGFLYTYIGWNLRREPFDDPRVRRALGMAIDVDAIIAFVAYDEGERTTGPYPPVTPWYDPGQRPLDYDPEGALGLLAEAGFEPNAEGWLERDGRELRFTLITNQGNQVRRAIMTVAQDAWRRLGVRVNTQVFEWAVFLQDFINPGEFDAVVLGWSMGANPDLYQLWHSSQVHPNQLNFVGYHSDEADSLIERIRVEYDIDRQRELARALHRRIAEDQPYTFLYAPRSTRVLDPRIAMLDETGSWIPAEAARSGNLFFHFNRWRRFEHAAAH